MDSGDMEKLVSMMWCASEIYDKPKMSKEAMTVFMAVLKDFTIDQVRGAMNYHIQSSPFFPKPADIVKHVTGSDDDKAFRAFQRVEAAIKKYNYCQTVRFQDPVIHYAIDRMGGWQRIGGIPSNQIGEVEESFCYWYKRGLKFCDWSNVKKILWGFNSFQRDVVYLVDEDREVKPAEIDNIKRIGGV